MAAAAPHSRFPGTSLTYITVGLLMSVLAGTSYFYFDTTGHSILSYLRAVTLAIGLGLVCIGFCVGFIGRAARTAELPPSGTAGTNGVQPANPAATVASPPGMVAASAATPQRHS